MLTILSARIMPGYSGKDHLISGHEGTGAVGLSARSGREAVEIASRIIRRETDRRVLVSPVEVEVQFASGEIRWVR